MVASSSAAAPKRCVVMDELYLTPAHAYFATLEPTASRPPADTLSWPVVEPTLCLLLRWIHSTMRHGTFDLLEVLAMAAPFERTCHAINRLQRLGADCDALQCERPGMADAKLVDKLFHKSYNILWHCHSVFAGIDLEQKMDALWAELDAINSR